MPLRGVRALFQQWQEGQERSRLWRVSRRLSEHQLRHDDSDDLYALPDYFLRPEARAGPHFLGYYSAAGIEYALREYGVWDRVASQAESGELRVEVRDTNERFHRIVVLDAVTGARHGEVRAGFEPHRGGRWLYIAWILSQRPGAAFTRAVLPGQDHPGSGVGRDLLELMLIMGHRLRCDGVLGCPAYFHNGLMYRVHFRFEDPVVEGRFLAMQEAWRASGLTLAEASHGIDQGRLVDGASVVDWVPGRVLAPLVPEAEFEDAAWHDTVREAKEAADLRFVPGAG